jgi:hypothetical protein
MQRIYKSDIIIFVFSIIFLWNGLSLAQGSGIKIYNSETYELSNIILALTPYGKSDPWEVQKKSPYYNEIIAYFDKYANHPLINKVNYSREKWDYYLSFRTDAYAFEFDNSNKLIRKWKFRAIDTLNEFEKNIDLVNDFVKVSGFRDFYKQHKTYQDNLLSAYTKSQMLPEVLQFLKTEFGDYSINGEFAIVISPLVNRMNCQRKVNGIQSSFITLPVTVLTTDSLKNIPVKNLADDLHSLFTEIDHSFVNPTTDKYKELYKQSFDPNKWDFGSGYEKYEFATFNEYMTWAAYDIFIYKYFPDVAAEVNQNWAQQNESRGFYASLPFNLKLKELYDNKKDNEKIADLFPKLLKWCKEVQSNLSWPKVQNSEITKDKITLTFTEPMEKLTKFDAYLVIKKDQPVQKRIVITPKWGRDGKTISFKSPFDDNYQCFLYLNSPWDTFTAIKSKKGIDLDAYTKIGSVSKTK